MPSPTLHLGVVAIEKGAFSLPSTTVANFTFLLIKGHNRKIKIHHNTTHLNKKATVRIKNHALYKAAAYKKT